MYCTPPPNFVADVTAVYPSKHSMGASKETSKPLSSEEFVKRLSLYPDAESAERGMLRVDDADGNLMSLDMEPEKKSTSARF